MRSPSEQHLVLVGGGHTHVQTLKSFGADPPPDCRLTVIAAEAIAMYSGMAPGFVAGDYERHELEIDVRPLAARAGAEFVEARVTKVDPGARRIELNGGRSIPFDLASFNIGSTVAGLDTPGVREHAIGTRPLSRLVESIDDLIRRAHANPRSRPFRVIVVGGGVGGVELAFAAQYRLARETGRAVKVTLLDRGERILAGQPKSLRRRVRRVANERGIVVRTQAAVQSIHADHVQLKRGESIPTDSVFWVTGPASHSVFRDSPDVETDERGFVSIRSTLQFAGHDHLFAAGDCATLVEHPETPKAGVYAVRQGPILTHNLRAALANQSLSEYRPQRDFLTLLNTGGGYALGTKWGLSFGGRWVMWWKDRLDRSFMKKHQITGGRCKESTRRQSDI